MTEERSLADVQADPEIVEPSLVDTTVEPTPEDFDLDEWLQGVRATRKSVKLHPGGHLIARLEELADEIENTPEDVNVDDKIDEFERLRDQFQHGVWFTIEGRSSEWIRKFRKGLAKRHSLKDDADHDSEVIDHYQMAEQVVAPAGVTFNSLRALKDQNEAEWAKLLRALVQANQQPAETSGVLRRDFSARRSDTDQR